ncbi:MAG: response regulator [Pseudomonadota bacterium]
MTAHSKKILFVDDDEFQRKSMKKMLVRLGYDVEFAEHADAALRILEKEAFPLIIVDLLMPDMDGIELCRRIRAINSEAVVYAFSGHLARFEPKHLEEIGFDGHLSKPIDIDKLKRSIEGALSKTAQKGGADGGR